MRMNTRVPVFDGHNDALLRLYTTRDDDPVGGFLNGGAAGHIDLPKARAGHLAGGLFAVFNPSKKKLDFKAFDAARYELPLPPELPMDDARATTIAQVALLHRLETASDGAVAVARSTAEIRVANARGALAAVLHLEGAESIDEDLYFLDVLHAAGLRSLGPVWSRSNIFGHGVPFRFPGSPDTGPGLTEAGKRLVAACNRLGVLIDLSHITEKGFWDVARLSNAPLVATHSNVHAICPTPRNLTADQLKAIRDSDGMVGLNFATAFLRPDGRMQADTEIEVMVRHLAAMVEAVGETRVGLGSDFDGAIVPRAIGSAAGLPVLIEAMRAHGFGEQLIRGIAYDNWLSLLARTIDRPQA
jgi:membrane dipeptidase